MKKTNKILTRALVILLALVLITSSVVSSTFAKYVVRKEATTTVELQKFGLKVRLTANDFVEATVQKKGDSIIATYNNVTLTPGEDKYKDAIIASVTGKANVPAVIEITVDIKDCSDDAFYISSEDFSTLKGDAINKIYNPITFYVNQNAVTTSYKTIANTDNTNDLEADIEKSLRDTIITNAGTKGVTLTKRAADGVLVGEIAAMDEDDAELGLDNIGIGFMWENASDPDGTKLYDEITTWISNHTDSTGASDAKFTITYTISVVQNTTT